MKGDLLRPSSRTINKNLFQLNTALHRREGIGLQTHNDTQQNRCFCLDRYTLECRVTIVTIQGFDYAADAALVYRYTDAAKIFSSDPS